ncbi:MAG TPA: PEGA domain-containing protein [Vicinamibacterales bacterium]
MKKHLAWTVAVAASLALAMPADAGQRAVPRGGGSSSAGSSGGSSAGGSSGGGSTVSSGGSSGGGHVAVPRHPGGSIGGSRGGSNSGAVAGGRVRSPGTSSSTRGADPVVGVPSSSRPQGNRPTTGYAVPRGTVSPPGRPGGDYWYYYPRYNWYYNPFGWGTWGLGYVWDPFWWGPGYGYPYGGYGWYGGGAYAGGGGYAGDYNADEAEGALRIKVKPREARVLVDGYIAGEVDDFDGNFQKLKLKQGPHQIELQHEGYEPLKFEVLIVEGQTVTYKGKMVKAN